MCSTCAARSEIDALAGKPKPRTDADRRLQRVLRRTIYIGLASIGIAIALTVAGYVTWRGRVARDEAARKTDASDIISGFDAGGDGSVRGKSTSDHEFPRSLIVLIVAFGGGGVSLIAFALRQRG